jgi:hypothetical protein
LITICSFCDTILEPGKLPDEPVSHGICRPCYERFILQYGFNVRKFLNLLDAPVLLVDSDVRILEANTLAQGILQKPVARVRGELGGRVMECVNAFLDGGCGKTEFCPDCPIRASVNETYTSGRPVSRRPASLCRRVENGVEKMDLLVSTRREGNVVLLRIEPPDTA